MAEQDTNHHPAGVKEEETQPTYMDHLSASVEYKQEETGIAQNVKKQHSEDSASSSTSANGEPKNNNGEDTEQDDVKDGDSAEEKMVPRTEGSPSPDEASTLTAEDNSNPPQADDGSHGDHNRKTPMNEQPTMIGDEISREYHTGEKKAPEATSPATLGDRKDDQVDGPSARLDEETTGRDTEAGEDDGRCPDTMENTTSSQTALPHEASNEEEKDERTNNIQTIGPSELWSTEPTVPVVTGSNAGSSGYLVAVGVFVVVAAAVLVQHLFQPESPPQKDDVRQIGVFLRQMDKLKTQFPNQRGELWNRSRIHLLRHLQTAQPTEPVSLILTAGVRAEKTLHCLAQGLASSFSSALNASVLHIDGASKASQDSDQVKLDIDSKLQGAFEGDKPVAVIHRFEELPPGSTLIFYRYCDHENAAYKKTFLIFTVLLGEEEEIPAKSRLSSVEEMVDDHLQKKFLSNGHPVSYDRMDLDKYSGLWSRISHLILPVAAEERMEHEGC